ncbi:MAG: protein-disulfide reductase DsbD domain-containing protein, partial [Pseudomonadota bacterium]
MTSLRVLRAFLVILGALVAVPTAAMDAPETSLRLFAEQTRAAPGQPVSLALAFDVKPGWHLYWKNPGDTGLEPKVRWEAPEGTTFGALEFPTPEDFTFAGFTNYGYTKSFNLLTSVVLPETATGTAEIMGRVEWLACDDKICVPEGGQVSLTLPISDEAAAPAQPDPYFAQVREALPLKTDWQAQAVLADGKLATQIAVPFEQGDIGALKLFPETGSLIVYEAEQDVQWVAPGLVQVSVKAQAPALPQGAVPAVLKAFPKGAGPAQGYGVSIVPGDFAPVATSASESAPALSSDVGAVSGLGLTASLPFA